MRPSRHWKKTACTRSSNLRKKYLQSWPGIFPLGNRHRGRRLHHRHHPFNQPDVEASKIETRQAHTEYEKTGSLPPESLFSKPRESSYMLTRKIPRYCRNSKTLADALKFHLDRINANDYFRCSRVHHNEPAKRRRAPGHSAYGARR